MAIGMAVLIVLLAGAGFLLKRAYAENGALETKLANANAVIAQREEDMKLSAHIVAKQADALAKLETKVVTVTEKIYAAPVTRECAQSPSMRASSIGVRDIIAPTVQPPAGRQPAPAVR